MSSVKNVIKDNYNMMLLNDYLRAKIKDAGFAEVEISKTPISPKKSINKIFFEEGKNNGIYLRTLGNIVMLVPPLAISKTELDLLIDRTIETIKNVQKKHDL